MKVVFGARARLIGSLLEKLRWHDCLLNSIDKGTQGVVLPHGKYESADIILESMEKALSEGGSVECIYSSSISRNFENKNFNLLQYDVLVKLFSLARKYSYNLTLHLIGSAEALFFSYKDAYRSTQNIEVSLFLALANDKKSINVNYYLIPTINPTMLLGRLLVVKRKVVANRLAVSILKKKQGMKLCVFSDIRYRFIFFFKNKFANVNVIYW